MEVNVLRKNYVVLVSNGRYKAWRCNLGGYQKVDGKKNREFVNVAEGLWK